MRTALQIIRIFRNFFVLLAIVVLGLMAWNVVCNHPDAYLVVMSIAAFFLTPLAIAAGICQAMLWILSLISSTKKSKRLDYNPRCVAILGLGTSLLGINRRGKRERCEVVPLFVYKFIPSSLFLFFLLYFYHVLLR